MNEYLEATSIIDYDDPAVRSLAQRLALDQSSTESIAAECFFWVRDKIRHSGDYRDEEITVSASDVLRSGTGLCYAKSHLLAALLRAKGIPTGFVYQRLADDTRESFCLHGLNAVWLPGTGWFRIDARGDRADITTDFNPPQERLAFHPKADGERTIAAVFAKPLPVVIDALTRYRTLSELSQHWPDWIGDFESRSDSATRS